MKPKPNSGLLNTIKHCWQVCGLCPGVAAALSAENVPHVLGLEQALAVHVRAVTLASPANLGQEETQDISD